MAYLGLKAKSFIREAMLKNPAVRMDDLFAKATDEGLTASNSAVFGKAFEEIFDKLRREGAFDAGVVPADPELKKNGTGTVAEGDEGNVGKPGGSDEHLPIPPDGPGIGTIPGGEPEPSESEQPTQLSVAGPGGSFEALYYEDRVELRATLPRKVGGLIVTGLLKEMYPRNAPVWTGEEG